MNKEKMISCAKAHKRRFEKIISLVLSLTLIISMAVPAFAADSDASSPFEYAENGDGTIEITGYNGDDTDLVIPAEIDGKKVTSIGNYAFRGCTSLESVTIPESVTYIEESAFYGCTSLKNVTIPKSVTSIGDNAFGYYDYDDGDTYYGTKKVDGFKITGYKYSAAYAYARDNGFEFESLGEVSPFVYDELKDGTLEIVAYYGDDNNVDIPAEIDGKKVTKIGARAFYGCTSLKSVTIPKSVTDIGYDALGYYYDMETYVTQVDGFKITGYKYSAAYAYAQDNGFEFESLGEVNPFAYNELEDGTLEIVAYYGDDNNIVIPAEIDGKKVTTFGRSGFNGAFAGLSLIRVTISDGVTSIGDGAFCWCGSLESVTIPESVTEIKSMAFRECGSLKDVTIPKNVTIIGDAAFLCCSSLESITIPENVTTIGDLCFANTGFKDVTIPKSVTSIGYHAFGWIYDIVSDDEWQLDDFTIKGYPGTAAEEYANENGFEFIALEEKPGDISGDGNISTEDNVMLERYLAGKGDSVEIDASVADLNGDGAVNSADHVVLQRHLAGWTGYETLPLAG